MLKEEKTRLLPRPNDKSYRFLYLAAIELSVSSILLSSTAGEEMELGPI